MTEKHDVVVAGGGHNGMIAACYLAKAGLKVCIVERNDRLGGAVMTRELTVPGFEHDVCSMAHHGLQANPLLRNDELGLKSRFGLKYANPVNLAATIFDDGTVLELYTDLELTCKSIARFSQRDAEAYRRFNQQVFQMLDMIEMGMFNVPPGAGMQAAMLDQSPQGREMMRLQAISAWDLIEEWFEHPKIRIALARYTAEAMTNPLDNGTGFAFYVMLPIMHKYGAAIPVGGSGALASALTACFESLGGTYKLNSTVKRIKMSGQDATGVVLESGEEILATKAVISSLHVKQVFPAMVPGAEVPDDYLRGVRLGKHSTLQPFTMHFALNEMPKFKAGDQVDSFAWIARVPSDVESFTRAMRELEYGNPVRDFVSYIGQYKEDPTRVPPGKHIIHLYAFAPYEVKGGAARWDEIGKEVAAGFLADLRNYTTNMGDENILGSMFMTPLDFERHNRALIKGDVAHLGFYSWQLGGNRPVAGWGQYRTPINRLFVSGASTHPGGGVTGASGRNVAQVVLEAVGLDFDKVVAR